MPPVRVHQYSHIRQLSQQNESTFKKLYLSVTLDLGYQVLFTQLTYFSLSKNY